MKVVKCKRCGREFEVEKALNLIKKNFFDNKDKVIVKKIDKPKKEEDVGLF